MSASLQQQQQQQQHAAKGITTGGAMCKDGGRFDFDDGGTYCGGWDDGKAHGHGVCTGPKGQGEYAGSWHYGFEVSGVYTWPSGSTYEGHWQNGKRHGLGVETRGRWIYRGEWTQGFKGRYGVRQSTVSMARYEGTWANGLQDGYGSETYGDGGTYQGQWLRGLRHGYGVRTSAPFGLASKPAAHQSNAGDAAAATNDAITSISPAGARGNAKGSQVSLNEEGGAQAVGVKEMRGGFVLTSRSDKIPKLSKRRSLDMDGSKFKNFVKGLRKQQSTGDLDRKGKGVEANIRSTGSTTSWMSTETGYTGASIVSEGSNQSFVIEDEQLDPSVTETYMGEWKNDKRSGFGISERSDGLKYEGEWYNNRKYGYGVTTFKDGTKEEGKYKNNILITSNQKRHLFLIRSAKFRERIESALNAANRASKIALQKADIAISRTATARGKAEHSDIAALQAREDGQVAVKMAQQFQTEIELATPAPNPNHLRPEPFFTGDKPPIVPYYQSSSNPAARASPLPPENPISTSIQPTTTQQKPAQSQTSTFQMANQVSHNSPVKSNSVSQPPTFSINKPNGGPSFNNPSSSHDSFSPRNAQSMKPATAIPITPVSTTSSSSRFRPADDSQTTSPLSAMFSAMTSSSSSDKKRFDLASEQLNTSRLQQQLKSTSSALPSSSNCDKPSSASSRGRDNRACPPSSVLSHTQDATFGDIVPSAIMEDRFEHYRRPPSRPPSREPSIDRMPITLAEANAATRGSRPPSRTRMMSRDRSRDDYRLGNGGDNTLRYRQTQQTQPNQEMHNLGTIPKRTESLYMKYDESDAKDLTSGSNLQRKKSLPDVQNLVSATSGPGSVEMTREEISELSRSRRDNVRRQMEDAQRYKQNPLLYVFNPRVQDWVSRQQLMILVLFVNLSLAFMFFKLLT